MKKLYKVIVFFVLLVLTFSSLGVTPAKAAGPGAGWTFQRTITLSAGTPSANFQVRVQLVGAPQHANMNADGSDLRFYDATDTQADYWIETWSPAGTSTIWVEVPTAGTTILTMYYGNAAATAVSNGDNTFITFDDFSGAAVNTSKWDVYDPNASITVSGGSVTVYGGDQMISKTSFAMSSGTLVETVLSSNVPYRAGSRASMSGASSLSGSATFFTADELTNSQFAVWSNGRDNVYGIHVIQDGDGIDNGTSTAQYIAVAGAVGPGTWIANGNILGTAFETGRMQYFLNGVSQGISLVNVPAATMYPLINNGLLTNIGLDPFSITTFRVRKFVNTYNPTVTVGAAVSLTNSCTSNVAEVGSYSMVYQLSIPVNADYNGAAPAYSVNNAASFPVGSFNRIGYCLQLDGNWVWVSMNAFTSNAAQTGVPVTTFFQQTVNNMNVASNVPGVVTGTGIATGNIEFWHNCYTRATVLPIGGNNGTYDFNDDPGGQAASCYGSMQVHNYGASQTIFAWNAWDYGNNDDLGIGNNPVGAEPDWTFRYNAGSYATRTLTVYVANDTTAPTITSATSTTANGSYNVPDAINITINFSESISSAAGLAITLDTGAVINTGALTNVTSYSGTYTVSAGQNSADLTVTSITGTITDAASNNTVNPTVPAGQNIADSKAIVIDTTAPTVSITSTVTDPTNTSPIPVTITFSESVTGFVVGEITVGNGTAGNFAGSGTTYTVDVTPAANGLVTVDVGANVAQDGAGNNNTAATQFSITFDSTNPTVTITSTATNPTNISPIPVTITFSESVTGFTLGEITVGNGTASNFAGSGITYTADITPTANGLVTVDVGAGVAQDGSGNDNTAASQFSITYDNTAPTVSITSTATDPTNTSPFPVTITFSESVTGFVVGEITVVNGTAGNFAGSGTTYTADITPTANGLVTVDVGAGVAQDGSGNDNTAATQFSITYDNTAPTVSITSTATDPTNTSPIPVTITFSESVTGFVVGEITVVNGTAGNFAGSGTTYTVDITPTANGLVTVDVGANVAQDGAGNNNTAATQFSITYDNTNPAVTVNQASGQVDPTNASPINFTAVFGKPINVATFIAADITLGGTAPGTLTAVVTEIAPTDGTTFNIAVSGMTGNGTVTASIAANAVQDPAGNNNTASSSTDNTVTYDTANPSVVTTDLVVTYTDPGPGSFTVTFNKAVSDPAGNTSADDVTNPANYLLVNKGANKTANTLSCLGGVVADDTQVAVNSVSYNNATFTSTVTLASPLPVGSYRLFVCGTTSIVDPAGNPLNGGTDYTFDFIVQAAPLRLPLTGFPQNEVSTLPLQPANKAYASYSDLWLEIPKLNVKMSIVGVPVTDKKWDVTWLGNEAGWLNGSAFPTWSGNSVLTGHVWDALNRPGLFAQLKDLKYGDTIIIHAFGQVYTYEVRESKTVPSTSISTVFKHEKNSWITLVTCEDYQESSQKYLYRRMVRAVLVSVK